MIYFKNPNILDDTSIKKLNDAVDEVIKQKKECNIDYEFLKQALKSMLINRRLIKEKNRVEQYISKEEMIRVVLDFYKSIDKEFYDKAVKVILQQENKIKVNIYDRNTVKDFKEEDENGIYKYDPDGSVSSRNGYSIVHIPIYNENNCTLEDLYTLVHEITHLLDFNSDYTNPTREGISGEERKMYKRNFAREMLGETTAIAFEAMFSDYLLKNTSYPRSEIEHNEIRRIRSSFSNTECVYSKLLLAEEKEKSGIITREWIEKIIMKNGLNPQYIRNIANGIINDRQNIQYEKRYAIAGLIAPTISKKYIDDKEEGIKLIKRIY